MSLIGKCSFICFFLFVFLADHNYKDCSVQSEYMIYLNKSTKFIIDLYLPAINKTENMLESLYSEVEDIFSKIVSQLYLVVYGVKDFLKSFPFILSLGPEVDMTPPGFIFNATNFEHVIRRELIGQHIAHLSVSNLLKKHLTLDIPTKALVISFQGSVGTGKTFLSRIIANNLFKGGFEDNCANFFYGGFFSHAEDKVKYYEKLKVDVRFYLSICKYSLFVFYNIDSMVPGVLDALTPFISPVDENSNENNFAKSIFIFTSNSGSDLIEQIMINAWSLEIPREHFTEELLSFYLRAASFNEHGGLYQSAIMKKNLIDAFIPFLPLEKYHIRQCILKEMNFHNFTFEEHHVEEILKELLYYPKELELFSKSGCKRVHSKVNLYFSNV